MQTDQTLIKFTFRVNSDSPAIRWSHKVDQWLQDQQIKCSFTTHHEHHEDTILRHCIVEFETPEHATLFALRWL